jgi:hypothetical protein
MRKADDRRVQPVTLGTLDQTATRGPRWRRRGRLSGAALVAAALVVVAGCASLPSVEGDPIPDMALIAGKWAGTMTPSSQGFRDLFYATIGADGSLTAVWGSSSAFGRIVLSNGHATYEMEPSVQEGTLRLYTEGGKRTLVFDDQWSPFRAEVTPQR